MENNKISFASFVLGVFIFLGLGLMGWQLASGAIKYKELERTVNVKGLAEQEHSADIVLWPIQFSLADNNIGSLYNALESNVAKIKSFLIESGLSEDEISVAVPNINDAFANMYGGESRAEFRYTARQAVTVYSSKVELVRGIMNKTAELGKAGIVLTGNNYDARVEYIFTRLNEIKPMMIEEATKAAREVAQKFAEDSGSKLGKIKSANQGQFSINDRDNNNPHIKTVRVVSTVVYYLSD